MLQAANGTGSAISLRLAIHAFWKPSHLSGNFRHETPDAYAAYRTWIWSGSVDCTCVVKYESNVLYTFLFYFLRISRSAAGWEQTETGFWLLCCVSVLIALLKDAASSLTLKWHWGLCCSYSGQCILNLLLLLLMIILINDDGGGDDDDDNNNNNNNNNNNGRCRFRAVSPVLCNPPFALKCSCILHLLLGRRIFLFPWSWYCSALFFCKRPFSILCTCWSQSCW